MQDSVCSVSEYMHTVLMQTYSTYYINSEYASDENQYILTLSVRFQTQTWARS